MVSASRLSYTLDEHGSALCSLTGQKGGASCLEEMEPVLLVEELADREKAERVVALLAPEDSAYAPTAATGKPTALGSPVTSSNVPSVEPP